MQRRSSTVSATTVPSCSSSASAVSISVGRHLDQLGRELHQLVLRQAAVALVHGLGERVGHARADPDHGVLVDADLGRDLVGRRKPMPRMSRASR